MAGNSNLRVLSGKLKGKVLKSPQNSGTHPMGSREKLALFNMLQPYIDGADVLDAYSGTGALGIEALSRGARAVTFVEKSPAVARLIRENMKNLGSGFDAEVLAGSVAEFIRTAKAGKYDLILADPPYDQFDEAEVAQLARLLRTGGVLALSFPAQNGAPDLPELELQTARRYAAAGIAIYVRNV